MSARVRVNDDGPIRRLTLDHPGDANTLDYAAITALTDAVEAAGSDPSVRAVALSGSGSAFCAGEDRHDMGPWPERHRDRRHGGASGQTPIPQQELVSRLWRLAKPTVAVIGGPVAGFGLDLACACDIRLASDDADFRDGRVADGTAVATGITYLLPRLIGLSQAQRMLLLGARVDADEAQRIGLVSQRAGSGAALADEAAALLDRLARMATRSYAVIKRQLLEQLDLDHDTALLHSLAIRQTHRIEDQQEGILAFREKRPPSFTGR